MKVSLGLLLFLAAALAGCTSMGYGFDDPAGEVSVVGDPFESCEAGRIFLFGKARNTGDLEVRNLTAIADLFGGDGAFLGRFQAPVSAGVETVVGEIDGEPISVDIVIDTLDVEESGTFTIRTTVGCGSAARAEYSFTFTTADFEEEL